MYLQDVGLTNLNNLVNVTSFLLILNYHLYFLPVNLASLDM